WRRAGGARRDARLHGRTPGLRPDARPVPGAAVSAGGAGGEAAIGPHLPAPGGLEARPRRPRRLEVLRHGEASRHRQRLRRRQPVSATARRVRLPGRLRGGKDRARPARPPDPRRHERDHAADRGPRASGREGLMADILIRKEGRAGRITLNRPKALNALTYEMCLAIDRALIDWAEDDAVALVMIDAEGDRAFSAGGDIAEMYATGTRGDYGYGRRFWRDEYRMNARIADYGKPVVSFLQGFTMGGGVGVGCHASHRIVGETAQIAMPECGIGLVPDVGGSFLLAGAPGHLGEYLGTTGARMGPADAILAGFADHFVPEADWAELKARLVGTGDAAAVAGCVREAPAGELGRLRPEIDAHFGATTLAETVRSLGTANTPFAAATLRALGRAAPLSAACAVEMV